MRKIYKYALDIKNDPQPIELPVHSNIVLVGSQNDRLFMWIDHNVGYKRETRYFVVRGTGYPITKDEKHIGSCIMGSYVRHVYEVVDMIAKNAHMEKV